MNTPDAKTIELNDQLLASLVELALDDDPTLCRLYGAVAYSDMHNDWEQIDHLSGIDKYCLLMVLHASFVNVYMLAAERRKDMAENEE